MHTQIQSWTWIALAALILAATAGRWVSASRLADPSHNRARQVSGDEILYIALGDRLWKEGRYDARGLADRMPLDRTRVNIPAYLDAPLFKHPPMFPFLVGMSRTIFWKVPGSSIYPSLLMGAVSLAAIFWLAKELGCSPAQGLLAVLLLAVSPVHWICSSRIWMDMTLTAFILLAVAAQIRAMGRSEWWKWAGVFWGCALLTKYTAFAPWAFALAASLYLKPGLRNERAFRSAIAITAGMFLPWVIARIGFEGWTALAVWKSPVEDWAAMLRMARWLWLAPVLAAAGWLWLRVTRREWFDRWMEPVPLLAWGTLAFLILYAILNARLSFGTIPWSGFGPNALKDSPRDFYLIRQILFEPVCWWGLIGLLVFRRRISWDMTRAVWAGLFLFLTLWGNFQSRYGLPLVPFELVFAAAVLWPRRHGEGRVRLWSWGLASLWILFSCVRSLWIVDRIAIDNKFFYF